MVFKAIYEGTITNENKGGVKMMVYEKSDSSLYNEKLKSIT